MEALNILKKNEPELVLFDSNINSDGVSEFFQTIGTNKNNVPVVIIAEERNQENFDKYHAMGAFSCLAGTGDSEKMKNIVNEINSHTEAESEKIMGCVTGQDASRFFADELAGSVGMVGKSVSILNTIKMIKLVSASRCNPILILGETGTGKELVAKAIHNIRHPNEEFVAVNCAALTANLLESELFGHVKGSFTGADRDKEGLLEIANAGTILLDEISEMPMELQAKLLRVLEAKEFRKVGGTKNIACKATIAASSNRNLLDEVNNNRFRRDLYYRLNISPIVIAPLRSPDRKEDISLIAEYFLKTSNISPEKTNKVTSLTKLAIEALEKHNWPGNVRELRNVIERAIMRETTDKIGLSGIIFDPMECIEISDRQKTKQIEDFSLEKAERELISRALQETGWQKTRTAALLGITRATLYAKVKQYNIGKAQFTEEEELDNNEIALASA
ncbi:MAG: sigma-54-dependent Fis family transcriptional regulator [Sedimentisphaerales bacterium]|nr:sigma-54-dependent Fis family transcriptional regulator [Sedimentisphaerales bacterium]